MLTAPLRKLSAVLWPLSFLLTSAPACDSDEDVFPLEPTSGALEITIRGGEALTDTSWILTGGALDEARSGSFASVETSDRIPLNTSRDDQSVSLAIGGIPVGDAYTIELRGSLQAPERECVGSTLFDVPGPGVLVRARLVMNCRMSDVDDNGGVAVDGQLNACPSVDLSVSPLRTRVGNTIDLTAQASDPDGDPVSVYWTASDGAIEVPSAPVTAYTCVEPGNVVIGLTADDGYECNITRTVAVVCTTDAR